MYKIVIFISIFISFNLHSQEQSLNDFLFLKPAKNVVTEALVVSKNGKIIFERFDQGNQNSKHLLWSMSKSFSSILFGIAETKGYINRDDSIYKYFSKEIDNKNESIIKKLKKIKLKHLLNMASGFDWNEYYEESPFSSDVVRMLYFATKSSVVSYVLMREPRYKPGTRFHYSSGDTNLLMGALNMALPKELKKTYPWEFLFKPLEIETTFETDAKDVFLGSSYLYMTTKDLIKFATLILDDGVYKGKQIVSKEYLDYIKELAIPMQGSKCLKDSKINYGGQLWLNKACANGEKPFPKVSEKLIMLLGHGGQSIFIFPEEKIIAVRIARDKGNALDRNTYAELLLKEFSKDIYDKE